MPDIDSLPPVKYMILEVLAARYRTGETWWTFPTTVAKHLRELEHAGLVSLMHGVTEKTLRVSLTDKGIRETISATYYPPHLTLDQGIDTLPATNDEFHDWMRRHGLGHGAGVGAVINAVRHDLRQLPGGRA
jgi:hypothetical protein